MRPPSPDSRSSFVSRRAFYATIAVLLLIDISVMHADRGSELLEDTFTILLTLGVVVAIALAWRAGRAT
jgi:hypothetical protein